MKKPVLFVALGMLLAFVVLAGVVIAASNVVAGTRLREFGNGDIDVNIALSRPTPVQPASGNAARTGNSASDALYQRDLEYESKLREMLSLAQTVTPAPVPAATVTPGIIATVPAPVLAATATEMRSEPTAVSAPAQAPEPQPTDDKPRQDDRRGPPQEAPPSPTGAPPPDSARDDRGGDRKTPEPEQLPPQPTDDRGRDNSGPSPENTPKPDERPEDQKSDQTEDNASGGKDKPPEPPKEDKP
jgi:hypothetical protein